MPTYSTLLSLWTSASDHIVVDPLRMHHVQENLDNGNLAHICVLELRALCSDSFFNQANFNY